jgi:hypothetical protein
MKKAGRPLSKGLIFFAHDTDTRFLDPILFTHGAIGIAVYWTVIEKIHRDNGYYYIHEERDIKIMAGMLKITPEQFNDVFKMMAEYGYISKETG